MTTHRSLRERQKQEREDLILSVAESVLLDKGYHDTSMDEIAALVGIAKGTLYLHFARKEDLVLALIEREMQTFLQEIEKINQAGGSPKARLEAILSSRHQGTAGKQAQLFYIIYNSPELQPMLFEKHGMLKETVNRLKDLITAVLDEGKASGIFDPTVPTPIMRNLFFSTLSPMAYKRLVIDEHIPADELFQHMWRLYFRAIAADPCQEKG